MITPRRRPPLLPRRTELGRPRPRAAARGEPSRDGLRPTALAERSLPGQGSTGWARVWVFPSMWGLAAWGGGTGVGGDLGWVGGGRREGATGHSIYYGSEKGGGDEEK